MWRARVVSMALVVTLTGSWITGPHSLADPGVGLVGEVSADDQAAYEAAMELFAEAGFELPPYRVHFHTDRAACEGNYGQVRYGADGVAEVYVCATWDRYETQLKWRARTLLHELSHVWVNASIDDETKAGFMAVRGVERWYDHDDEWGRRGIEHSAEVFLWGLVDGASGPDFRIDPNDCPSLAAAYEVLTGRIVACP